MGIRKPAAAGALKSSDCQVTVEPGEGNIEFALKSAVVDQYGNQIRRVVMKTLENLGVKDMKIAIVDKGALDYTIRTRVKDVVFHTTEQYDNLSWRSAIR